MSFFFASPYFSLPTIQVQVNLCVICPNNLFLHCSGSFRWFLTKSNLPFLSLSLTSGFAPCCKPFVFTLIADSDNDTWTSWRVLVRKQASSDHKIIYQEVVQLYLSCWKWRTVYCVYTVCVCIHKLSVFLIHVNIGLKYCTCIFVYIFMLYIYRFFFCCFITW